MDANYVCLLGGRYEGYNKDGERFALPISEGDKVTIDFDLMPYTPYIGGSTISFQRLSDNYNGDKYACICTESSIIYIKQDNINKYFRPIDHKHLEVKTFDFEDELNKFLSNIQIDCVKDIKFALEDNCERFMLIYINNEDD